MNCRREKILFILIVIIILPLVVSAEEEGFFGDLIIIQQDDEGSYQQLLKGQARIVYNSMTIISEEIFFAEKTKEIVIEQKFRLNREGYTVSGGNLQGFLDSNYFKAKEGVEVTADHIEIKADELFIEENLLTFEGKVSGIWQNNRFSSEKLIYRTDIEEIKFEGNARILPDENEASENEGE